MLVSLRQEGGTSLYVHLCTLWSCCGVMVVGGESEKGVGWVRCEGGGVVRCISRYTKNEKKKTQYTFLFVLFSGVMGAVLDGCGIH
jgi:hypothetical protein